MTTAKAIKQRIKAAKNITQITKAMEMVAASKMRRSQEKALSSRPYATKLLNILAQMSGQIQRQLHPFLRSQTAEIGRIGLILISSDRGLCGPLNTNLFRGIEEFKDQLSMERPEVQLSFEFITVGKKAREQVLKTGQVLHAEFTNFPERPSFSDSLPISKLVIDGFLSERFSEVHIASMKFISTLKQIVQVDQLLPIVEQKMLIDLADEVISQPGSYQPRYIFEPDAHKILDWLLPYYVEIQVFQKILESQASEHSARMVTMRNASDNAKDVVDELTLIFNRQRQQAITNEIADIVTSTLALE